MDFYLYKNVFLEIYLFVVNSIASSWPGYQYLSSGLLNYPPAPQFVILYESVDCISGWKQQYGNYFFCIGGIFLWCNINSTSGSK